MFVGSCKNKIKFVNGVYAHTRNSNTHTHTQLSILCTPSYINMGHLNTCVLHVGATKEVNVRVYIPVHPLMYMYVYR